MVRKIYDREGLFIYKYENDYYMGQEVVKNKSVKKTKEWWELERLVEGKRVRIIVYDNVEGQEEGKNKGISHVNDFVIREYGDRMIAPSGQYFETFSKVVIDNGFGKKIVIENSDDGFKVVIKGGVKKSVGSDRDVLYVSI